MSGDEFLMGNLTLQIGSILSAILLNLLPVIKRKIIESRPVVIKIP
jgi:hypothetical protein